MGRGAVHPFICRTGQRGGGEEHPPEQKYRNATVFLLLRRIFTNKSILSFLERKLQIRRIIDKPDSLFHTLTFAILPLSNHFRDCSLLNHSLRIFFGIRFQLFEMLVTTTEGGTLPLPIYPNLYRSPSNFRAWRRKGFD